MCQVNTKPANDAQLQQLRDPAALTALSTLTEVDWLAVDVHALDRFFANDPTHPAKRALEETARQGGRFALLQFAVLIGFTLLAIVISAFQQTLSPVTFVLWGSLGVCAGLMVSKYPGRFFGKRKSRA
jgi:hypothetical protein